MSLFPDSTVSSFYTGRSFGPSIENATNLRNGSFVARNTGEYWSDVNGGTPVGVGAGAWALPVVRGSISAFVRAAVELGSASIQEGREISGNATATFTVSPAELLLTALLNGSASITISVANADLGAAVGISGSTSFSITPSTALLGALAEVLGSATFSVTGTGLLEGYGALAGNITPYTELSPQSLSSAVWSAVASQFNESGTMGNKLNSAASGGVDYQALGEAVWAILLADANVPGSMGALLQDSSPGDVAAAVLAAAQTTPIYADTRQMNGADVIGTGELGDAWRGVGVPP